MRCFQGRLFTVDGMIEDEAPLKKEIYEQVRYLLILIRCYRLVIITGDANVKDQASSADTDAMLFNIVTSHLFAPEGRYHFFDMASCNIFVLRDSVVYQKVC